MTKPGAKLHDIAITIQMSCQMTLCHKMILIAVGNDLPEYSDMSAIVDNYTTVTGAANKRSEIVIILSRIPSRITNDEFERKIKTGC